MLRFLSLVFVLGSCLGEVVNPSMSTQEVAEIACDPQRQPAIIPSILGTIESLNYPIRPDDDIYCEYLLEPNTGTADSGLVIAVKYLYTEPDFDLVKIYNGGYPHQENMVQQWSGYINPDTNVAIANTSSVLITFENDCWTSYSSGFEIVYYSMDVGGDAQDIADEACSGSEAVIVLDDANPVVFIETENFPNSHPRPSDCTWVIKAACDNNGNSHNLTVTVLEFELGEDDDDFLDIFQDRGPNTDLMDTLQGRYDPMSYSLDVEYGTMELRFEADEFTPSEQGFRLAVSYSDSTILKDIVEKMLTP